MNVSIQNSNEQFIEERRHKLNKIEEALNVEYNRNRHQFKNSECGVYSINFILRLLEGESFEDYKTRRRVENGLLKEYLRGVWVKDD